VLKPPVSQKITVKADRRIYQIEVDDILFIEACGDYVSIQLPGKKLVVHGTLKSWEERLDGDLFQKVHRTNLVNLRKIDHLEGNLIYMGSYKVPFSDTYKPNLLERMFK
jgi:DNA-binding LytR/AlgR family response regulator